MPEQIVASLVLQADEAKKSVGQFKQELKEAKQNLKDIETQFGTTSKEAVAASDKIEEISAQLNGSSKAAKTLKAELKEAVNELQNLTRQFGENSAQSLAAARNVALLRDEISDASETAGLFDPGNRFAAVGGTVQTLTGGFSALTGVLVLFGETSDITAATIAKLQSVMAIQEGFSAIANGAESFKRLFAIIKTFSSTGIGLLITGLASIVTYFTFFNKAAEKSIQDTKEFRDELASANSTVAEAQNKMDVLKLRIQNAGKSFVEKKAILKTYNKEFGDTLGIAKSVNEAEQKLIQSGPAYIQILTLKAKAQAAANLAGEEQKKILQSQFDAEIESVKKQKALGNLGFDSDVQTAAGADVYRKQREAKAESVKKIDELNKIQQESETRAAEIAAASGVKSEVDKTEKVKKEVDKRIKFEEEAAKQRLANDERAQEQFTKLRQDNYLQNLDDDNRRAAEKIRIEFENSQREIQQQDISENKRFALLRALREKQAFDLQQLEDKITKERNDRQAEATKVVELPGVGLDGKVKAIGDTLAEIADMNKSQYDKDLENLDKWRSDRLAKVKGSAAAEAAIEDEYAKLKKEITDKEQAHKLSVISNTLGSAASLFSKYSTAYKVLAISQTLIDTYQSATSAFKSLAGIPLYGPYLGGIAAGLAVASGLANVAKIASVKIPGGGGEGAPAISASAPLIPQTPQTTQTSLDANSIGQIGNAANQSVRAYVVSYDSQNAIEREQRINRAARIA